MTEMAGKKQQLEKPPNSTVMGELQAPPGRPG